MTARELPLGLPGSMQLFVELVAATEIKADVIDGRVDFSGDGFPVMTVRVIVTEEIMNKALAAHALKEQEKARREALLVAAARETSE